MAHLKSVVPPRQRMERMLALVKDSGVTDQRVLGAMSQIPRELFVAPALAAEAYDDRALPIGFQQTISMPTVVAHMTQALELTGNEKILEIGTGCGYQASILCKLAKRVFSIERIGELAKVSHKKLADLGCTNFVGQVGDGTLGWPQQAPFAGIIVTAAGFDVPQPLLTQLAVGGKLVIPVGPLTQPQKLLRLTRLDEGTGPESFCEEFLGYVTFVPLVGTAAFRQSA